MEEKRASVLQHSKPQGDRKVHNNFFVLVHNCAKDGNISKVAMYCVCVLDAPRFRGFLICWYQALALAMAAMLTAKMQGGGSGGGGGGSRMSTTGQKFRKKITIPQEEHPDINFLGLLIGPRGSTQKQMQQDSGAKILIRGRGSSRDGNDEDPHEPLHVLVVADSEDSMQRGARMVEDIVLNPENARRLKQRQLQELGGGRGDRDDRDRRHNQPRKEIKVPNGDVGLLIGRGGETIRRLQHDFGCQIQIERKPRPGSPNRVVTLSGPEDAIEKLHEDIRGMMNNRRGGDRERGPQKERKVIMVPGHMIGMIIGKGGETIRGLRQRTGAYIQVTKNDPGSTQSLDREVVLSGTERQIEHADQEIMEMIRAREADQQNRGGGRGGGGFGDRRGGQRGMDRGGGGGGGGRGRGGHGGYEQHSGGVLNPHSYQQHQDPHQMMMMGGGGYNMYGYPGMGGYPTPHSYGYPPQIPGGGGAAYMQPPPKPDPAYEGTPFYGQQVQAYEAYQQWKKAQDEMKAAAEKAASMRKKEEGGSGNKDASKEEGGGGGGGGDDSQNNAPTASKDGEQQTNAGGGTQRQEKAGKNHTNSDDTKSSAAGSTKLTAGW
eukprot:jgi/Bigna1/145755/aug1.103_g20463